MKQETHDKINKGQIQSLLKGLNKVNGMMEEAHCYIVKRLLHLKELNHLEQIEYWQWQQLRSKFYPKFRDNDWTLDDGTRIEIADLLEEYKESELGQKRLFE